MLEILGLMKNFVYVEGITAITMKMGHFAHIIYSYKHVKFQDALINHSRNIFATVEDFKFLYICHYENGCHSNGQPLLDLKPHFKLNLVSFPICVLNFSFRGFLPFKK